MPVTILMPALSPTMEVGTLAKWYVKEGESVLAGDILADIETDKATMEFEAIEDGRITNLLVAEGTQDIPVNQAIAELTLDENDEPAGVERKPYYLPTKKHIDDKTVYETRTPSSKEQVDTLEISEATKRIKISPLARRIAENNEIDVRNIVGSGPHGRIIKRDIPQKQSDEPNSTKEGSYESAEPKNTNIVQNIMDIYKDREHKVIQLSGVRKIIASRLSEAKRTIPHFYLRRSIQLDKLINIRGDINQSVLNTATKFSINDFIIKAVAKSLQDNPKCNAIWGGDHILQLNSSDVAVAVAIDGGLITPVIRDAEKKTLEEISNEMKEKSKRAKEKKLRPEEYNGGSSSISNLGMMGIENFDAVINPPQASILAVGSALKKPLVNDTGEMYVGHAMSVTLSADHRVIDGAEGAAFIATIVEYLSNPLRLIL